MKYTLASIMDIIDQCSVGRLTGWALNFADFLQFFTKNPQKILRTKVDPLNGALLYDTQMKEE